MEIAMLHLQRMIEKKKSHMQMSDGESDREAVDAACHMLLEVNQKQPGPFETCHYTYNFQAPGRVRVC